MACECVFNGGEDYVCDECWQSYQSDMLNHVDEGDYIPSDDDSYVEFQHVQDEFEF